MAGDYRPNVRQRRLARTLKAWREVSRLRAADIAERAGWSKTKQSKLGNATEPIRPADVVTVALILGINERERDALFNDAQAAQDKGWWETISQDALVADVRDYVELESEASRVRTFKLDLVDGLLQTAEYATAIGRAAVPRVSEEILQRRVEARIQRQARLSDGNPLRVEAIVTEGALRVEVGGPEVMGRQLDRLLELAKFPNVDLRVLPAQKGAYPAMGNGFNLLSFATDDPDVGYLELVERGVYVEDPEDVAPYTLAFDKLWQMALNRERSVEFISATAHRQPQRATP